MSKNEELKSMRINTRKCKECCKDISEEEYKKYKGYCKNCYMDRDEIERKKREFNNEVIEDIEEDNLNENNTNIIANVIKFIAVIVVIAGIIIGIISIDALNSGTIAVVIIIASIISSVLFYAIGEIIQILQNIENNTKKCRR